MHCEQSYAWLQMVTNIFYSRIEWAHAILKITSIFGSMLFNIFCAGRKKRIGINFVHEHTFQTFQTFHKVINRLCIIISSLLKVAFYWLFFFSFFCLFHMVHMVEWVRGSVSTAFVVNATVNYFHKCINLPASSSKNETT